MLRSFAQLRVSFKEEKRVLVTLSPGSSQALRLGGFIRRKVRRRPDRLYGHLMDSSILIGLATIFVLGIGAQWLSWRLRFPSILPLLLCGFIAGAASLVKK